jgi:penicillin amidase
VLERDEWGVPHVRAADEVGLYWGMGYFHARDRGLQMLLFRILGRGEACRCLEDSDAMFEVDRFFRRMNWRDAASATAAMQGRVRELVDAYVAGVDAAFARSQPWELRLVGYRAPPWTPEDCLLLARMTGYLTLAQSQGEIERWLVELVQAGLGSEHLEELFPGRLAGLDVELVRRVVLGERIVPEAVRWQVPAPRLPASNNWVVAGSRTATGSAFMCNDPHLEINRLPNVWAEMVLTSGERWFAGATMPGLPAMLVGRTRDLAWGATYAFMDATDSWIEDCRDGRFRRGEEWVPFSVREETIERKRRGPLTVRFHENEHGVLDGDPERPGLYLSTRWSGARMGEASLLAFADLWHARGVEDGMKSLGRVEPAFNWVLADRAGRIGYQMSGLCPRRRAGVSGLVPLPGWDPENDWKGFCAPEELPRELDPERGYIVTANQDLGHLGRVPTINACMADYRAQRIVTLLEQCDRPTVEDMQRMHYDVHAVQVDRFWPVLEPLLPPGGAGETLRAWDRRYTLDARGATLFERIYDALLDEVLGGTLGAAVVAHLRDQTAIVTDFYAGLDELLLAERSLWFGGRTREEVWRAALARALAEPAAPWGEQRSLTFTNIFVGGKLPAVLGFDRGPVRVPGGRSTVLQLQIYRNAGRLSSMGPSIRMVADLGTDRIWTNLCGGPSDRRFSPWYCSDLRRWQSGEYKPLSP